MKNKNIIALLIATSIVSSLITYSVCRQNLRIQTKTGSPNISETSVAQSSTCSYNIRRLKGFKFIRPLQYAEPECEGAKFLPLKAQLQNIIVVPTSGGLWVPVARSSSYPGRLY